MGLVFLLVSGGFRDHGALDFGGQGGQVLGKPGEYLALVRIGRQIGPQLTFGRVAVELLQAVLIVSAWQCVPRCHGVL
jgi:hypothetical protein